MPTLINLRTHARKENSDDRAVRVCGCSPSIGVRREKSLRSLAKAGQTRDTRTRVVKHTCASLREEDHASESVLEHHTLRAIVTPLRKWLSPLLVLRGALRYGLVPTCSVNFDACELREASLSTGVRCDNPIPHDFMSTLRCVSQVGGAHIFWFTCLGFAVCLDTSRIFGSWSRRAVFAISSTFTTAPSASICVLCDSRVFHVPFVFGPYQLARTGVLMRLSDLRITLYASWRASSFAL